jgi:RNA polymerase sigma-70 factor (ECF subfamily)
MDDLMTGARGGQFASSGSDARLAARARSGDVHEFSELVHLYDPAMRRLAFRLLGSFDAMEDAVQAAYVKAFRSLGSYREEAQFGSWLYRITYNACLDELRRGRRRPSGGSVVEDFESPVPGPERSVAAADTVRTALAGLPVEQRATVVLVDGEGFDNQSAAQLLGVAPGTVASRLSRARAALRRAIEEVDDDRT